MQLIDTNIAIHLRDGTTAGNGSLPPMDVRPAISILTLAELEGGVSTVPALVRFRRAATDALTQALDVVPLDHDVVATYGTIVATRGFSRARVIDRLIAATAIVHGLTLVTINGDDFRDIPGLDLEIWPAQ